MRATNSAPQLGSGWQACSMQGLLLRGCRGSRLPGVSLCLLGSLRPLCPGPSPSAKEMMLGCLERWMLRNEGGVMGSNTQLLGQAHQASCSLCCWSYSSWLPGLLSLGRDLQSAVPQQRCTINAPCRIRAAFSPCSGALDNYCHCLVALSTDFCTSALPGAVGFLLQGLGAVALLSCLGDFSRRIRLAERARWGKERTGAAVVLMSEQEMPRGPSSPIC